MACGSPRYSERDDFEWLRNVTLDVQRRAIKHVMGDIDEAGLQQHMIALHNLRFSKQVAANPELNNLTVCTLREVPRHPSR